MWQNPIKCCSKHECKKKKTAMDGKNCCIACGFFCHENCCYPIIVRQGEKLRNKAINSICFLCQSKYKFTASKTRNKRYVFLDKLVKEFNDQVQWAPCVLTSELPPDPTSSNIATGGDPQDFLQDAKDYAPQELKNYQTWNSTMINSLLPNVTTTYQQRFQQFSQDLVQYLRDQKGKTNDIFDENHEQRPIPVEARKSRYNVDQAESTKESKQHPTIKDAELVTLLEARETRNSDFRVYLPDDEEYKLRHFYAPDDPDIE